MIVGGLLDLSWWQLVLTALVFTHITIVAVTVYLHRCQAHRALDLHPLVAHFFRFWLWLTTGMVTREWVGIHRRHHARCETAEDPHSPQVLGLSKVLWEGAELYRDAAEKDDLVTRYAHGTPDDWIEHHVYRFNTVGIGLMLIVDALLFGVLGIAVWAVQMIWIPFFAAGVINGIGHFWGYRNFESPDAATNISPWGIVIGGEELHNNHHAFPSSAKLSCALVGVRHRLDVYPPAVDSSAWHGCAVSRGLPVWMSTSGWSIWIRSRRWSPIACTCWRTTRVT